MTVRNGQTKSTIIEGIVCHEAVTVVLVLWPEFCMRQGEVAAAPGWKILQKCGENPRNGRGQW